MRARIGDVEAALVDLARSVASDTGASSSTQLPPAANADKAWNALGSSGLLNIRAEGGTVLDLVLCA